MPRADVICSTKTDWTEPTRSVTWCAKPKEKIVIRLSTLALLFFGLCGTTAFAQVVDFGDDSGDWTFDNECDDPRFDGPGMSTTTLLADDLLRDASDCRTAFKEGRLTLRGIGEDTIDFGDDAGEWANDNECDDMRFQGPGMTTTSLLFEDIMHDAADCRAGFDSGQLTLRGM
jgi:hypothetical protein